MKPVHEMKTKFELKIVDASPEFAPLTFELAGNFSKEMWETFRTILPMFLEQAAAKEDATESTLMADVEVTREEELAA